MNEKTTNKLLPFLATLSWLLAFGGYGLSLFIGILIPFTMGVSVILFPVVIIMILTGFLISRKVRLDPALEGKAKIRADLAYNLGLTSLKLLVWVLAVAGTIVGTVIIIGLIAKMTGYNFHK